MSGCNKLVGFLQRNVVIITGVGIIVATHWGWNVLQQNPRLVPENERRELPIIIGLKHISNGIAAKFGSLGEGGTTHPKDPLLEEEKK